jgi:acetyl-CoA acetyltransferase
MSELAAIVGIGQTEFSKNSGRSELQLAAEAAKSALDDAGLRPADVDGMITFTMDPSDEIGLIRCLGVRDLAYTTRIPGGGAASVATLHQAMAAVTSGIANTVLIWRAMNERSAYRFGQPMVPQRGGVVNVAGTGTGSLLWCMPFGAQTPATWEALAAQRYMSAYGVTSSDLGHVSVAQRKHAATNPAAWFYGKPITHEEHQQSRWIVEPVLRLLDCCQESDGGVSRSIHSVRCRSDFELLPLGSHRDARGPGCCATCVRELGPWPAGHAGRDAVRRIYASSPQATRGVRLLRRGRGKGLRQGRQHGYSTTHSPPDRRR